MKITLALDWTPNTIHTGFYVAQAQGLYQQAGLVVSFLSPDIDHYAITSPGRVARGLATFGISPSEMVVDYHVSPDLPNGPRLAAIAAILQPDVSAIVTPRRSGRARPAQLDDCVYAAYDMRLEHAIVRAMIRQDGGRGVFKSISPPTLSVPDALLSGQADSAWMFMSWEGLLTQRRGLLLNVFPLENYGVPYGYAPVIMAHPDTLQLHPAETRAFLQASARGFEFAAHHAEEAAQLLIDTAQHESLADGEFVHDSQRFLADSYLTANGRWGWMEPQRWQTFIGWLSEQHILTDGNGATIPAESIDWNALATNQFL